MLKKTIEIEDAEIGSCVYFCGLKWEVLPMMSFKYVRVRCGLHSTDLPNGALVRVEVQDD